MLEDLPSAREKMVSQYYREKEEKLKTNQARDYIKERGNENRSLFSASIPSKINIITESKVSMMPETSQKQNTFQEIYPGKKR
ncbi:hypothetical protein VO54_01560 [Elizabethkingia miricola]|nr:hypothetical protein VO54_01560 [Elizabethkingia miricola]